MRGARFNYAVTLLVIVLWSTMLPSSIAAPMSSFTPPTNITVRMYRLFSGGGSTGILCSSNDTSYGCTAFVGDSGHAYPYGTNNPITIPIETVATEIGRASCRERV